MTRPLPVGPIVGHTDHRSTRIWIQVRDPAVPHHLVVSGIGAVPFTVTSAEFGTALAVIAGLQPDHRYRYRVFAGGRAVPGATAEFRTMPPPGSLGEIAFVSLSCSDEEAPGAWSELATYVDEYQPHFVVMTGDQVYLDAGSVNVWDEYLDAPSTARRAAMAAKYRKQWTARPEIRSIMACTPIYMIWDDHEIRDGWGSWAPDSPTLEQRHPRGRPISKSHLDYFRDARDLYWHFQHVRNPWPDPAATGSNNGQPGRLDPEPGDRFAMPYWFDCGRLRTIVLDGRGARDVFRTESPVLGRNQWTFLEHTLGDLPVTVDALAVVTPVPVVAMSPEAVAMRHLRDRYDDVELFARGRSDQLRHLMRGLDDSLPEKVKAMAAEYVPVISRKHSDFKVGDIDDLRDQWSHPRCRPEQERLLQRVATAVGDGRPATQPRAAVFLGGDIHAGAVLDLVVDDPPLSCQVLVASAIAHAPPGALESWFLVGETDFEVADGIGARLSGQMINAANFGVTTIRFTGATPEIDNRIVHPRRSTTGQVLPFRG